MHHADRAFMGQYVLEPPELSTTGALAKLALGLRTYHCPLCAGLIVDLVECRKQMGGDPEERRTRLLPKQDVAQQAPPQVTNPEVRRDYAEAHATAPVSCRGAAALARRALQNALRDRGFTHSSSKLQKEIEAAEKSPEMPSSLREKLDFLREVGNAGAHPNVDHAGEIVDVTEGEIEMLLEILDEFFDVFFVRPAKHQGIREAQKARVKGKPTERT